MIPYYEKKSKWKLYLGAAGALVLAFSLFYTNYLAQKLTEGEKNKMLLWAKAYESISKNTPILLRQVAGCPSRWHGRRSAKAPMDFQVK